MKIVIDIPEKIYKELTETAIIVTEVYPLTIERALTEGIALPKGHGDLKDASKMIADLNTVRVDNYAETIEWMCNVIDSYPTIIEADKEAGE